jgi:Domain of unknown function (DUF6089)
MKNGLRSLIKGGIIFTLFSVFAFHTAKSQYVIFGKPVYEAGITFGPGNFLGDLGGNSGKGQGFLKDNNFQITSVFGGVFLTMFPSEFLGVRFNYTMGKLQGADSIISGKGGWEEARKTRNLSFQSPMQELFVAAELYPTVFLEANDQELFRKFRPYLLGGVAFFHFNPKAEYTYSNGRKEMVSLQPLRTEGQGMPGYTTKQYSLFQWSLPYGIGVKYFISERINLSLEVIARKTFTDYIDDVSTKFSDPNDYYTFFGNTEQARMADQLSNRSNYNGASRPPGYGPGDQRGTPTNNDAFYTTSFKLGYRLNSATEGGAYLKKTRCPKVVF